MLGLIRLGMSVAGGMIGSGFCIAVLLPGGRGYGARLMAYGVLLAGALTALALWAR